MINIGRTYTTPTTQGNISVWDSQGEGTAVIFIHGNSACKEAFRPQFESDLAQKYRFIAIDLPGHGNSDNAIDKTETYSFPGYAKVVIEVLNNLKITNPVVVGWSLGGHIALSMRQAAYKVAGLLITGTPPINVSPEGFHKGFLPLPLFETLFTKRDFSREEAEEFMGGAGFDVKQHPFIAEAAMKTDEYARPLLYQSMLQGFGGDQKRLVETDETSLCIVLGGADDGINNTYIVEEVRYKNLFNQVYIIPNAKHNVFWADPAEFNRILGLFLSSVI